MEEFMSSDLFLELKENALNMFGTVKEGETKFIFYMKSEEEAQRYKRLINNRLKRVKAEIINHRTLSVFLRRKYELQKSG